MTKGTQKQTTQKLIDKNERVLKVGDEVVFFNQHHNPKLYLGNEWILNKFAIFSIESSFTFNHLMRISKNIEIIDSVYDNPKLWDDYPMPKLTLKKLLNKVPHSIEK